MYLVITASNDKILKPLLFPPKPKYGSEHACGNFLKVKKKIRGAFWRMHWEMGR